jgi:hypothetical protein
MEHTPIRQEDPPNVDPALETSLPPFAGARTAPVHLETALGSLPLSMARLDRPLLATSNTCIRARMPTLLNWMVG